MVIKYETIEVTKDIYNRLLDEFNGRAYGRQKGLNILLYRNIKGKYFIQSSDHVKQIIK